MRQVEQSGPIERETNLVINKYLAELLGTFILVVVGSLGILAVGGASGAAEIIAIGFAFGLALLAGIWVVGHVSGAHFNPAVTLAMLLDKRVSFSDAIGYWIGQFAGAGVASLVIWAITDREAVGLTTTTYTDLNTAIVVEVLLTAIFVWTIMAVTKTGANHAPAAIALTLVAVHLAGIPFSGASVNPARSFGPAAVSGGDFGQLWVYIYAPLIGAVIAWALYRLFPAEESG
ncbi:MAG: aquaporin [Acidobacteria bacterium]|nr:MAG: aquaporin [Acidobacteriota bacterium]